MNERETEQSGIITESNQFVLAKVLEDLDVSLLWIAQQLISKKKISSKIWYILLIKGIIANIIFFRNHYQDVKNLKPEEVPGFIVRYHVDVLKIALKSWPDLILELTNSDAWKLFSNEIQDLVSEYTPEYSSFFINPGGNDLNVCVNLINKIARTSDYDIDRSTASSMIKASASEMAKEFSSVFKTLKEKKKEEGDSHLFNFWIGLFDETLRDLISGVVKKGVATLSAQYPMHDREDIEAVVLKEFLAVLPFYKIFNATIDIQEELLKMAEDIKTDSGLYGPVFDDWKCLVGLMADTLKEKLNDRQYADFKLLADELEFKLGMFEDERTLTEVYEEWVND